MDQPDDHDGYTVGVVLFCIGALFELLTEPLVILGQAHQYVTTKVEGGAVMLHIMPCDVDKGAGGGFVTTVQVWLYRCCSDVGS